VRITKVVSEGRWNRAKALQRLLTCSFYGKAVAVKRVTENHGKKTAGVDGVTAYQLQTFRRFEKSISIGLNLSLVQIFVSILGIP